MKQTRQDIEKLVGTALLAALVIVLQCFVVIPLGAFTITLSLVPIMLGAILYGIGAGAILGGIFGAVVCFQVISGAAGGLSTMMLGMAPVVTLSVCMIKGILAGLGCGFAYRAFRHFKNKWAAVVVSAFVCPLINTGLFVSALFLFYYDLMMQFAVENNFLSATSFIFVGIVGLNFLVELVVNVALVPMVMRVVQIAKKS